jgi:signal transduction histidine kinase
MRQFFHNISIKHKLNLIILTITAAVLLLSASILVTNEVFSLRKNLSSDLLTLTDVIGINASVGLIFDNRQAAEDNLASLKAKPNIIFAHIFDFEGNLFASYYNPLSVVDDQLPTFSNLNDIFAEHGINKLSQTESFSFFDNEHLDVFKPIIHDGEMLGTMYIYSDLVELKTRLYWYVSVLVILIPVTLILAFLLASQLQRVITTPINDLLKMTTTVSKNKDYSLRAKKLANDEVGSLIDGFNDMLLHIEKRTAQLKAKVEELTQTRHELVQSEKMASLGRLVAGFAHELNTPIGVAVGTASLLSEKSKFINQLLEDEEVDEEELISALETIDEASKLTLSNLRRAAGLVSSFKRTAVDQTSEQARKFTVKATIEDVINTLHNKFKRTSIKIQLECPEHLEIYSIPGTLEQIVTNLMMNSLIHGFEEGKHSGHIMIAVHLENQHLLINYLDTGKGIAPDALEKVFEPFFTTHRAHGGSGLGMYICYNLVTSQLKGTMNCKSTPDNGVNFRILFPVSLEINCKAES